MLKLIALMPLILLRYLCNKNEEDVGVKVDCSDAFNTFEVFVQFVVVGTGIILHRCLLMANLI